MIQIDLDQGTDHDVGGDVLREWHPCHMLVCWLVMLISLHLDGWGELYTLSEGGVDVLPGITEVLCWVRGW